MKQKRVIGLIMLAMFLHAAIVWGGVSNFTVNGVAHGAKSSPGEVITWQYNLSVGGTAEVKIWVDVDTNAAFTNGVDFLLFQFSQQDNGPADDGPPDMDGQTNGQIFVQFPHGLAPAHYLMAASENGVADTVDFQITPMENPVYTVYGTVRDKDGNGVPWVMIEANNEDENVMPNFWHAFTDSSGSYVIAMDSSAADAQFPWHIDLNRELLPNFVISGPDTGITITGNHGPIDFLVSRPAMFISGSVLDANDNPLQGEFGVWAWNPQMQINRNGDVQPDGHFAIGFEATDVGEWEVGVWSPEFNITYLQPISQRVTLNAPGDSLLLQFHVYSIDATIWGRIEAEGDPIVGGREVEARSQNVGRSVDTTDAAGYFAIPVSSAGQQYEIQLTGESWDAFNQAGFMIQNSMPVMAAPGDTVVLRFTRNVAPGFEVTINGMTSGAQITQGDTANWFYRLPVGDSAHVMIWYDMNNDWIFDPMVDAVVVEFTQSDNGPATNGPPDMDGATNGEIHSEELTGLAPGHYFLQVMNPLGEGIADFTVFPIPNPTYRVFGQVLDANGNGIQGFVLELKTDDPVAQPNFWTAITDQDGNFFFGLNQSAGDAQQPWRLKLSEYFIGGRFFARPDTSFSITGDHGPIVFQEQEQISRVLGSVLDEQGQPLPFPVSISATRSDMPEAVIGQVDQTGNFELTFQPYQLGVWDIQIDSPQWDPNFLKPSPRNIELFQIGQVVQLNFQVFVANDTIWGKVEGLPKEDLSLLTFIAHNETTGVAFSDVDTSGMFVLRVSNLAQEYELVVDPDGYSQIVGHGYHVSENLPIRVTPGDTAVIHFTNEAIVLGNLLINGMASDVQIHPGEMIEWSYQIPVGSEAFVEVWVDKDGDHQLSPSSDLMLTRFSQVDGGQRMEAPPDMDWLMNGRVSTRFPQGLAPAYYFIRVFNDTDADTAEFEVVPLSEYQYSIFGRVLDETGQGVPWIMVEANPDYHGGMMDRPEFWMAFTDSSGYYVIAMDSTIGPIPVDFELKISEESLQAMIAQEGKFYLQVSGNHGPYDFHLLQPKMFIDGVLRDEDGNPLFDQWEVGAWNQRLELDRRATKIDSSGHFMIYFAETDTGNWIINVWGTMMSQFMSPYIPDVRLANVGDTASLEITMYRADTFITGRIVADGDPMVGGRKVTAFSTITGFAESFTDQSGFFQLSVSGRAPDYQIDLDQQFMNDLTMAGFHPMQPGPYHAAPGDTIIIAFTRASSVQPAEGVPVSFGLEQNYPNPFSLRDGTSTKVEFQVAQKTMVNISIYNLLGQKVAELLNQEIAPGRHSVEWNGLDFSGAKVTAGVYFMQMKAPGFVQRKKLLIIR